MDQQGPAQLSGETVWWIEWEQDGRRQALPLNRPIRIGRDQTSDIVLTDRTVSRQHAVVTLAGGRPHVDAGSSRNGIDLGGTRVGWAALSNGQTFSIARTPVRVYETPAIPIQPAPAAVPSAMPDPWRGMPAAYPNQPQGADRGRTVLAAGVVGILALVLVGGLVLMAVWRSGQDGGPGGGTVVTSGQPSNTGGGTSTTACGPARDSAVVFTEGFEDYPLGGLAGGSSSRWVQAEVGRVGDVTNTWVHSGQKNLQVNSFVYNTERDYAPLNLTYKPCHLAVELWYTPDGYFIYQDFAAVGLGNATSQTDLNWVAALWASGHDVLFKTSSQSASTTVFGGLGVGDGPADMGAGTPVHNYIRMDFDLSAGSVGVYVGSDQGAPLRATVDIRGMADFNAFFVSGGLNPTYIDDIKITAS